MTLFFNYVKRLLRSPVNLIFMIFVPVGIITAIVLLWGGAPMLRVGVVDNDNSAFTRGLKDNLAKSCKVVKTDPAKIADSLVNSGTDYVIVIGKGFTRDIIAGRDVKLEAYSIKETDTAMPVKVNVESYLNAARNIAKAAGGDNGRFYRGMDSYVNGGIRIVKKPVDDKQERTGKAMSSMGFLVMSMLYLSSYASIIMLQDMRKGTFHRMLSAPLTIRRYMVQSIGSFLAVSVMQVALIFIFILVVFKGYLGPSPVSTFVLLVIFSLVSVSLGVSISSLSRDERLASVLSTLLTTPICMLGGCFWPIDVMPGVLRNVSNFVPTTWVLKGVSRLMDGASLAGISNEILVLLLFALVFFILGSLRKVDVAK